MGRTTEEGTRMLRMAWIIGMGTFDGVEAMAHSSLIPHGHPHGTWTAISTAEGLGLGLFLAVSIWVCWRIRAHGLNG